MVPGLHIASRIAGHTAICEDALRVERISDQCALVALADGAGVGRGGALAAAAACDMAIEGIRDLGGRKWRKRRAWERLFRQLDQHVRRTAFPGETTLIGLAALGGQVFGAAVGDSAAWLLSRGGEHDLTAAQRREPLIGCGSAEATFFQGTLAGPERVDEAGAHGGGALVVMSDGAWRYVDRRYIADAALHNAPRGGVEQIETMARAALNGRLIDDLALVIVRR